MLVCSALCLTSVQVSATFAASLVTSPAIGAYLSVAYGDTLVVILATAIALLDICFILVAVPESLPEKMRPASWGAPISWEQADPFAVSSNITLLIIFSRLWPGIMFRLFPNKQQLIRVFYWNKDKFASLLSRSFYITVKSVKDLMLGTYLSVLLTVEFLQSQKVCLI